MCKEVIISEAKKMVEAKKLIMNYSNGKISKKELNDKGVHLSMPL